MTTTIMKTGEATSYKGAFHLTKDNIWRHHWPDQLSEIHFFWLQHANLQDSKNIYENHMYL